MLGKGAASIAPPWPHSLPLQVLHHHGLAHCRCKHCTTVASLIAAASIAPLWPRSLPLQALHHRGLAHCRCKRCTTVASLIAAASVAPLWPRSKQECDWSISNKPVMCWPRQASFSGTDSISDSLYTYVFNFYMYIPLVYSKQVSNISL